MFSGVSGIGSGIAFAGRPGRFFNYISASRSYHAGIRRSSQLTFRYWGTFNFGRSDPLEDLDRCPHEIDLIP